MMGNKNFFLISFIPAIAYWYLEENYPIRYAIAGGLALSIAEICAEKYFTKHVHTLSKFTFYLILVLGSLSLIGDEGIWFKLQPAFTGWAIGGFMIYKLKTGVGLMQEMMESMPQKNKLPPEIFSSMEEHIGWLFAGYGTFMAFVATSWSTDRWLFFKTIGFYIAFLLFFVFEMILIRRQVRKRQENLLKAQILKNFKP
jgi:intracellular septation protein